MALLPTVAETYEMAKAILADVNGDVYSDAVLAPFAKRACHKAARYLTSQGMGLFRKESADISVPAITTRLERTAGGGIVTYPADMLRPIEIKERLTTETNLTSMRCQNGFLPTDVATGDYRQYWDWLGDVIVFPAGLKATVMRIQYEAYFTDPSSYTVPGTQVFNIPDGGEAIAQLTAAFAFYSRDETANGDRAFQQGMDDLAMIATAESNVATARAARYGRQ